jgi:hypothetical protein
VAFRKKLYTSLGQLQSDLDVWLAEYNEKREHSGKYCYGKTPWQTFLDSKHLAQAKMLDSLTATGSSDVELYSAERMELLPKTGLCQVKFQLEQLMTRPDISQSWPSAVRT